VRIQSENSHSWVVERPVTVRHDALPGRVLVDKHVVGREQQAAAITITSGWGRAAAAAAATAAAAAAEHKSRWGEHMPALQQLTHTAQVWWQRLGDRPLG
jgi:hypothetical protein